jgi:hypothetical protein
VLQHLGLQLHQFAHHAHSGMTALHKNNHTRDGRK